MIRLFVKEKTSFTRYITTAKDGVSVREEPSLSVKALGVIGYKKEVRFHGQKKLKDGFVWMFCDKPSAGLKRWMNGR